MSTHSVSRLCRASLTIGGGLLAGLTTLSGAASAAVDSRRPPHAVSGPCHGTLTLPAAYARFLAPRPLSSGQSLDDPVAATWAAEPVLFTARPVSSPVTKRRQAPPVQIVLTLPPELCAALHPFEATRTPAGVRAVTPTLDLHLPPLGVEELDVPHRDPSPALTAIGHPATRSPQPPAPSQTTPKSRHPRTSKTHTPRPPRTPKTRTPNGPGTRAATRPGSGTATRPGTRTATRPGNKAPEAPKTRTPGKTSPTSQGDLAAAAALARLGTPFSWGGGSPSGPTRGIGRGASTTGFDCSGLTLYAWSRAGVKLGHYTGTQFRQGRRIPLSELRRGDLVFFGGGAGDPTHVGLYLGDGVMVHAPKTGDVVRRTSFLTSAYYRPLYRGAVRPG
ncbi:C40 family peptidase [Nonomuraea indica]|uniref:NlpC/P60 family protein n=1 Tax=Nonomuraea indica TaxID=1581193 RepID=A0ABW8ACJ1_9ACTN